MAQNEIKKYDSAADLHSNVRNVLDQWYNNAFKLERFSNFLADASASDYPDSPVVDLATLRNLLATLIASSEYADFKSKVEEFIRI